MCKNSPLPPPPPLEPGDDDLNKIESKLSKDASSQGLSFLAKMF